MRRGAEERRMLMGRSRTSTLNLLMGVDKPTGMTSHDVVSRVRRALGERRVGHAGTLDPLASGVLVIGVGQATRLMGLATAENKRYIARFVFGRETQTDDAEGETRCEALPPLQAFDAAWASEQMGLLTAMTSQVPPSYSAIQVNGVRAYDAARKGSELVLEERPIAVTEAFLCSVGVCEEGPDAGRPWWDVALTVSKGTYVRALARDLGRLLGSACHVASLRRMASGLVCAPDCVTLDALEARGAAAVRPLDPCRVLQCTSVPLTEEEVAAVKNGQRLSAARTAGGAARGVAEGDRLALVWGDRLYAVATREGGALISQVVFPDGIAGVGSAAR